MKYQFAFLALVVVSGGMIGCGSPATDTQAQQAAGAQRAQFMLSEEPDGAIGVIAAREESEDGAPLVLVGRIGGATNPWIDGRAAFTLIDPSIAIVAEGTEPCDGEVCMGDCCAAERKECTTLVKFIDAEGGVLPIDARELLGVKEADMVVIRGNAKKDQNGNFTLLATGIFVRK